MSDVVRFNVYSDIHYDRLGARCITVEDCAEVEIAVIYRAGERDCHFVLFAGDRYLKREPEDEVKTKADLVLYNSYGSLPKAIPHFHLVGNHDWTKKSLSWHTSESLWCLGNARLMSSPATYASDLTSPFLVHALPADHQWDFSKYQTDPSKLNIFTFHDTLRGTYLDNDSKILADFGVYRNDLDRPEFDYVFAGDIHIPQRIPFSNTQGGYVGAVLQRTMADANQARGWVEVEAVRTDTGGWDVRTEFVPTRNFFTKASFNMTDTSVYEDIRIDEQWLTDQYVEVELIGNKANVDRVANDPRWVNYETFYRVRHLEICRTYKMEQGEVIVDMSTSTGLLDDLNAYLDSGFAELGILPREGVTQAVSELMKED